MSNRTYDVTLAASVGAAQRIDATGSQLQVLSATGGNVGVKVDGGPEYTLLEGQGFALPPGQSFRDVVIRNLQAVAQTVTIFIGSAGFQDRRITGTVRVIDQGAEKTAAGQQFLGSGSQAAVALNGSLVGMRAVGKSAFVKRMQVSSTTAGNVVIWSCTGDPTASPSIANNFAPNKSLGASASLSKRIAGTSAAADPTTIELPGAVAIASIYVPANTMSDVPLTTPIQLASGMGLVASSKGLNRDVLAVFDFEES